MATSGVARRRDIRPRRSPRRATTLAPRTRTGKGQPLMKYPIDPFMPAANVVLTAVPAEAAGGASGLFSTAQQLGGAAGAALPAPSFGWATSGHTFAAATARNGPYAAGAFMLCALLLARTAVSDAALTGTY